jgi:hypothetical protein
MVSHLKRLFLYIMCLIARNQFRLIVCLNPCTGCFVRVFTRGGAKPPSMGRGGGVRYSFAESLAWSVLYWLIYTRIYILIKLWLTLQTVKSADYDWF